MSEFRVERDSMGDVQVPALAYYGAQTQRAVENFPISGWPLPTALVHAMGLVKFACAVANRDLGKLTGSGKNPLSDSQVEALLQACRDVVDGRLDDQFPVDVFQTGSGTSSNMNINEVIANRAIEILEGDRFAAKKPIHPNDHVNMGQSTNDTFPTAIHVAVALELQRDLIPALERLHQALSDKAREWDQIIKIGRTHLMDATPLRLGQEFGGFARQIELSVRRTDRRLRRCGNCPSEERPSAPGLILIRSLDEGSAKRSRKKPGSRSRKQWITLKPTRSETDWSNAMGTCGPWRLR